MASRILCCPRATENTTSHIRSPFGYMGNFPYDWTLKDAGIKVGVGKVIWQLLERLQRCNVSRIREDSWVFRQRRVSPYPPFSSFCRTKPVPTNIDSIYLRVCRFSLRIRWGWVLWRQCSLYPDTPCGTTSPTLTRVEYWWTFFRVQCLKGV